MSKELLLCPYCGNDEPDTTTKESLAMTLTDDDMVRCGKEGCPIRDVNMTVKTWNRRFVCLDKHGKKVFAGDEVKLTIDQSRNGKIHLLACFLDSDKIPLPVEWIREDTDRRGLPLEIELIESEGEE